MQTSKKRCILIPVCGFLTGVLLFILIYGTKILDPTYDTWITNNGGDLSQHYLGWVFYRNTPWKFPVGLIDGLTGDISLSCMFTDSIPFLALFFKILSPVLPETFQYLGIWGILSFGLKGALSSVLVMRFSKSPVFCICGSICFTAAPVTLQRMYGHEALGGGQYLIILALTIWAYQKSFKKKSTFVILWSICAVLAVGTHMYFIPMVYMIMAGSFINYIADNRKLILPVVTFFSSTACALLVMFCFGAFYGEGAYFDGGLGVYSSNLNTLFNPVSMSKFLKDMNMNDGQGEGFGYLGLGMIFGLAASVFIIIFKSESKNKISALFKKYRSVLAGIIFTSAAAGYLAVFPVVTINARTLFTINYPGIIFNALSVFRASGRFIWTIDYIIYAGIFWTLSKTNLKRMLLSITVFCTCLQMLDLKDSMLTKRNELNTLQQPVSVIDPEYERIFTEGADKIVFLPIDAGHLANYQTYSLFGNLAVKHHMTLSSFYTARTPYQALAGYSETYQTELQNGSGRENILYVFFRKEALPENNPGLKYKDYGTFIAGRYKK